ncbi:helix-hairpin-helix domain-containing protein [Neobacillus sp. LXY-4]|uniref:helix-hairpin-helix domain-containing protein n=1 Tax=Neobacillus sp. LXY-4 TaxID=3379826 RepID=UPI003EE1E85E
MKEWIKEYKGYVFGLFLFLCLLVYYFFAPITPNLLPVNEHPSTEESQIKLNEQETTDTPSPTKIMIDLKGAVKAPGVYEAHEGERVIDVLERSGGLLETADESKINLAMYVKDEMVIYIPQMGEVTQGMAIMADGNSASDKVNINTAEASELETLPGIGPSKSAAIIEYREKNGPFKSIEDIQSISGIGQKTFEKLKDKITIQ